MSVSQSLQNKIASSSKGWVFSANDFVDIGTDINVDTILHRMAKNGIIRRLGYGLYDNPKTSDLLGPLSPTIQDIINAYARKLGQTFVLDPLNAANALGVTTQVPSKLTYLTDGKSRVINVCALDIHFVHAAPKVIAGAKSPVGIFIQALRYFGSRGAPDAVLQQLAGRIKKSDLGTLNSVKNNSLRIISSQIDRMTKLATIH
jgi:hypothetical protein